LRTRETHRKSERLLRSMERSSSLQLRLQQLVEGLSVVALSYYGISLIGYMLGRRAPFRTFPGGRDHGRFGAGGGGVHVAGPAPHEGAGYG
jgi:hypothetical protein